MEKGSSEVYFIDQSVNALVAIKQTIAALSPDLRAKTRIIAIPAESTRLPPTASDIIIAGVGVQTTQNILDHLFPESLGPHRLILAPQQKSQAMRLFLRQRGFRLHDETVIKERGRFREILILEQEGEAISLYGDRILRRRDEISLSFKAYLKNYYAAIARRRDRYSESVSEHCSYFD